MSRGSWAHESDTQVRWSGGVRWCPCTWVVAAVTGGVPAAPRTAPVKNVKSASSSSQRGRTTGCRSTPHHSWPSYGESRPATPQTLAPSWSTAGALSPSSARSCLCPFRTPPRALPEGPERTCLCSAGVGRTGCFIVIDAMLERIKPEKTVDVYGHVTLMRSQRNYMVQTEDQYSFIHEALLEAVGCGNTEVPARSLYAYIQKLAQVEPGEHVTGMELEFKVGKDVEAAVGTMGGPSSWSLKSPPTTGMSLGWCSPPAILPRALRLEAGLMAAPAPCSLSGWPTPKPTHPASSVPTCLVTSSRTAW